MLVNDSRANPPSAREAGRQIADHRRLTARLAVAVATNQSRSLATIGSLPTAEVSFVTNMRRSVTISSSWAGNAIRAAAALLEFVTGGRAWFIGFVLFGLGGAANRARRPRIVAASIASLDRSACAHRKRFAVERVDRPLWATAT
jgi:hypothetical protein